MQPRLDRAQTLHQPDTVLARQPEVDDGDVETAAADQRERFIGMARDGYGGAAAGQDALQRRAEITFIVDYQDGRQDRLPQPP